MAIIAVAICIAIAMSNRAEASQTADLVLISYHDSWLQRSDQRTIMEFGESESE